MLQLLVDVATAGTAQDHSVNAHVVTIDPSTPDTLASSRAAVNRSIDDVFARLASGWTPTSAVAAVAAAYARVAAAEAALEQAKIDADAAHAAAEEETTEAAEADNTPPAAAKSGDGASGPLPDDFPGVTALRDAGITTYAKLRAYGDVTEVAGIGPATDAKIQERLASDKAAA